MASKFLLGLFLVGFACTCSGADLSKMLEELLSDDASENDRPLPPGLPRPPPRFRRPPFPPPSFRRPMPPPPPMKCVMQGKKYEYGDRWIDEKCTARCRCRRYGIGCVSLCPPSWAMCGPGEVESTEQRPVDREGRCFCTVPVCVNKGDIESMTVKK